MKSYVDSLKTIHGKGQILAVNEIVIGDYNAFFKDLERYQKVTLQDIKDSAQKYLQSTHLNLITVSPQEKGKVQ